MRSNGLDRSPIHLLHRAGQCAGDIFAVEVKGGLTPRQLAVLMAVAANEGLSQTDLVEATGVDRSTLADIVRRLKEKGLLQRRRTKEDARAYAVRLTEEGRRVLRTAEPIAKRVDDRVLGALPAGQRERFLAELLAIVEVAERIAVDGDKRRQHSCRDRELWGYCRLGVSGYSDHVRNPMCWKFAMAIAKALLLVALSTGRADADTKTITIKTPNAQGATCVLSSPSLGTKTVVTPATLVVQQTWHSIVVRCTKECFQEGLGMIHPALFGGYNEENKVMLNPVVGCKSRTR
jgi:DNA-binding MarR family transcriptional regulator